MMLSCGDALIDFVPASTADGSEAVMPKVGGSCLNIAIGLARLGVPTGFVGGISVDMFGRMIADHASASNVELRHATRSEHQTTLAFVRIVAGESQYAFYDAGTASRNWTYGRGAIPFETVDAIHIGSTTLVNEVGAAETAKMISEARSTVTISFDPNCRPNLVRDKEAYRASMEAFAERADIVRMSDVDFDYLYGGDGYEAKAARLLARGTSLFVVTRGADGAQAWHRSAGTVAVAAPPAKVVDTIGAGDSFQAALLFALHELGRIRRAELTNLSRDELHRAMSFAAKCAAFTCTRAGADPPHRHEIPAEW